MKLRVSCLLLWTGGEWAKNCKILNEAFLICRNGILSVRIYHKKLNRVCVMQNNEKQYNLIFEKALKIKNCGSSYILYFDLKIIINTKYSTSFESFFARS